MYGVSPQRTIASTPSTAIRSQTAGNFSDAQEPKPRQARPGRSVGGAVTRGQGPRGAPAAGLTPQLNE